ncbi:glycine N-acyltransferase-like [Xyrichtys novacula]|uniref:Glycine N-acyltransferase-like protein n=1 Tax=Xyrichtys novacula TaxID=13765 RepID=A0AAV1G584_XYRNO|nr:glycine N-acyltransferase-like [Xyrichtys novacula]
MELNKEQMRAAETELRKYLPQSLKVYGVLMLKNRVTSDPLSVIVDKWPDFRVFICRPHCEKKGSFFKDILIFATDGAILTEIIKKPAVMDWTKQLCIEFNHQHVEVFRTVASEKGVPGHEHGVCHVMILEDVSNLPSIDSSGVSLSSLDESHISLLNQTWKFGKCDEALRMIQDILTHFPSCCMLDAEGKPVAWILVYSSSAMGMLYTLPEHRGKGYAKVLIYTMAKRLHAEGYPVYCFIEEDNTLSYRLFKNLGFTEDPSYRAAWFRVN